MVARIMERMEHMDFERVNIMECPEWGCVGVLWQHDSVTRNVGDVGAKSEWNMVHDKCRAPRVFPTQVCHFPAIMKTCLISSTNPTLRPPLTMTVNWSRQVNICAIFLEANFYSSGNLESTWISHCQSIITAPPCLPIPERQMGLEMEMHLQRPEP